MDIKTYLAPLTNNERAVLLHAAGVKWRCERTGSVDTDIDRYSRCTKTSVPAAQQVKAVEGLLAKGYITLEPKRGNYYYRTGHYIWPVRMLDGNSFNFARMGAPYHKMFAEKSCGGWQRVDWLDIANVVPVKDVAGAVEAHRAKQEREGLQRQVEEGKRIMDRQAEREKALADACRAYLAAHEAGNAVQKDADSEWYSPHSSVGEIERAAKYLTNFAYNRRSVERSARSAEKALA